MIGWTSSPWDEVEEDSPDSSSAPSSSFLNSSAPMESPDRRNWRQKALVRQPWIAELRERINPLERWETFPCEDIVYFVAFFRFVFYFPVCPSQLFPFFIRLCVYFSFVSGPLLLPSFLMQVSRM